MKSQVIQGMRFFVIAGCTLLTGCRTVDRTDPLSRPHSERPMALAEKGGGQHSLPITPNTPSASRSQETLTHHRLMPEQKQPGLTNIRPVVWEHEFPIPPAPAGAAETELPEFSGSSFVGLNELLDIAVEENPTLRQAQALVQQAQGNWSQVGLYPNPTLEWHDEANNAPFDAHYATLSQDIVTGGKLKLNRAVASHDVQRAQWEAEAQQLRVLNEVQIRYILAWSAQRQVVVAQELLKTAEEGLVVSERMWRAEEVSEADALQARLQLNDTSILLRDAQTRAVATWKQLANVIGRPDFPVQSLVHHQDESIPQVDWEAAWQEISQRSPQLHAARTRATAAQFQVQRERAEPIPNLQLSGSVGIDAPPGESDFLFLGVGIGATLPVFDKNQGNIMAATGELRAAQWEVARLELALRDGLAQTFQRFQSAQSQVEIYREKMLPTAERNLSLSQKAYEEGEFDFLRVLTAREAFFQAQVNYVESLTELKVAGIEIQGLLLTGGLDQVESNPTASNGAGQTAGYGK